MRSAWIPIIAVFALQMPSTASAPAQAPTPHPSTAPTKVWRTLPEPPTIPTPTQSGDIEVSPGVTIHYARFGHGQPVVLLHGGLGALEDWSWQISALAPHYEIIAIDSRAQGRSSHTIEALSYAQMADDTAAVLQALQLPSTAVVGWSDGGIIALELAIRHPAAVLAMFVIGTNFDTSGMRAGKTAPTVAAYFARAKRLQRQRGTTPRQLAALLVALRQMWRNEPHITAAALAKITVPVAVTLGEYDELIEQKHAALLARTVGNGTFTALPNASHFAMWQTPDAVNALLLRWLRGVFP